MRAFLLAIFAALAFVAHADPASEKARAMDAAMEAFLIGTWTYTQPDAIGSRTLYIRFDKNRTATIKASGDSNILPGPLSSTGVFWKVNSITETSFFLEINVDTLMGGGVRDLKRMEDGTLHEGDGTVWTRID